MRLGPAPYGYELSHDCDEQGRRQLVPLAHEQDVLRQIESMSADGLKLREIARRLNEAKIPLAAMASGERRASALCFSAAASTRYAPCKSPGSAHPAAP